jgi:predicted kinase
MNKKHILIYTFGVTHSGKSTFAKEVRATLGDSFEVIDPDTFDAFIDREYPHLGPRDLAQEDFDTRRLLKYEFFKTAVRHAFWLGLHVVAPLGSIRRSVRERLFHIWEDTLRIAVVFDYPEEVIVKRISEGRQEHRSFSGTEKPTTDYYASLYRRQKTMQEPLEKSEYEACFRIYNEASREESLRQIAQLVLKQHL